MSMLILWLTRFHRQVLLGAAACALASAAALAAVGLRESYTVASFVGSDSPEFERLEAFMSAFANNELALVAVRGRHALDARTRACLNDLVPALEALPAVRRVGAISQLTFARALLVGHPLVQDVLISRDQKTAAVLIQMHPESSSGDLRRRTVADFRRIVAAAAARHPDLQLILTGPYVTMLEMFEFVRQDLKRFALAVLALMLAVLYAVTGSWRVAAYALGVAAAAVLCTLGLSMVAGVNMSLTTQMIVTLITVLAVATCVHLAVGHTEAVRRASHRPRSLGGPHGSHACRAALNDVGMPCTAVIVTSAAGFASVCISDIRPIRSFGALMVFGLLLALILALSGVALLDGGAHSAARARLGFQQWLARRLSSLADRAVRRRHAVLAGFAVATALLAIPIPRLRFESDFVKNFRKGSAVRRGYEFVEQNLAPLGMIEMLVHDRQGRSLVTLDGVRAAAAVTRAAVAQHEPIRKAVSLADCLRVSQDDLPSSDPELQARYLAARQLLGALFGSEVLSHFVTADQATLRISFMAREGVPVDQKLKMVEALQQDAARHFGADREITVTGLYPFYATLIAGLVRDQNLSLGLTAVAIFLVTAGFLRSWKLALVGMIPNVIPMVACAGLMGWFGIPVNMATAMMLAISLGIAVDDTIHYLWRFRRELQYDGDAVAAILRTHRSVGQACVFTTVVITGGFWILCFSRFLPTAYFGGLVGVTMIAALAADLMLLPALLLVFRPVPLACRLPAR